MNRCGSIETENPDITVVEKNINSVDIVSNFAACFISYVVTSKFAKRGGRAINTSIYPQSIYCRGSLRGYLYSGEDLPLAGDEPKAEDKPVVVPIAAPAPATPIRQAKVITIAQVAQIERLLSETGSDRAKLLTYFGVDTLAEIAVADYPRVVRSLEKRRAAA